MNKSCFAKIIPDGFLKEGSTVEEDNVAAKLREITITGLTDPFQIIIDDSNGAFTRFLRSGDNSGGIQKVCDAILFSNNNNKLQPIFVELKSSSGQINDVILKMNGTNAILHYYRKILEIFYNIDTSMEKPLCVLLYFSDRGRKRVKDVKDGDNEDDRVLYICPVADKSRISLQGIRNS